MFNYLFLYVHNSGLTFQHKNVHTIKRQLNKDFANSFEWFVDNKLSIHLGKDKTFLHTFWFETKVTNRLT